jgi:DNA-binding NtrC family response regulator
MNISNVARVSSVPDPGRNVRGFKGFVGESSPMRKLYRLLSRIGPSSASVVLVGESGTGKELAARVLHDLSPRREGPFIAVNAAAIPETLIEGELFGHEKGAFTGAINRQQGCFELANHGTLFLDELTAMPLSSQVKLLRAIEERSFRRLRGREELTVDVRILAATNQSPEEAVREGKLREDLLYRINVFTVSLPPLRERASDIPLIANRFIEYFGEQNGKNGLALDRGAESLLARYSWPGNVRELRNAMERAVILANDSVITLRDLPPMVQACAGGSSRAPVAEEEGEEPPRQEVPASDKLGISVGMSLDDAMRSLTLRTLEATGFNKTKTAQILGVTAKTIYNKLKEWSASGFPDAQRAESESRNRYRAPMDREEGSRLVCIDTARGRFAS